MSQATPTSSDSPAPASEATNKLPSGGGQPKAFSLRRVQIAVASTLAACALAMPLDPLVFGRFDHIDLGAMDWYRMLRIVGYLPTWLIVALAFVLIDSKRAPKIGWPLATSRMGLMGMSVILAAIIAELMKLGVRRLRPNAADGQYLFRAWTDGPLNNSGLGMPSSHAAVAFAAMTLLCYLYPRAAIVWIPLAIGCALSRCITDAHFISDAAVGAALGILAAKAVWHDHLSRHHLDPQRMTDRPFA